MSNRTNFQLINKLIKYIDTDSLQINMSESIYFTVKTSKELDFNDIFEVAKVMEKVTGEEVEFVEKREDNIVVFRCLSPKKEEAEYKVNPKAVKKRKIPELVEDNSLICAEIQEKKNIAIIIAIIIIGVILCYLINATENFKAVMSGLMIILVMIMINLVDD